MDLWKGVNGEPARAHGQQDSVQDDRPFYLISKERSVKEACSCNGHVLGHRGTPESTAASCSSSLRSWVTLLLQSPVMYERAAAFPAM